MLISNLGCVTLFWITFGQPLRSCFKLRYGRTVGTCHTMRCDLFDDGEQLRTLGNLLSSVEEFATSLAESLATSINFG